MSKLTPTLPQTSNFVKMGDTPFSRSLPEPYVIHLPFTPEGGSSNKHKGSPKDRWRSEEDQRGTTGPQRYQAKGVVIDKGEGDGERQNPGPPGRHGTQREGAERDPGPMGVTGSPEVPRQRGRDRDLGPTTCNKPPEVPSERGSGRERDPGPPG